MTISIRLCDYALKIIADYCISNAFKRKIPNNNSYNFFFSQEGIFFIEKKELMVYTETFRTYLHRL